MSLLTIGADPTNRASLTSNDRTYINAANAALHKGQIIQAQIWAGAIISDVKIKVFRDDGTNYLFIGESGALTTAAGLNTYTFTIANVSSGDFIGVYSGSTGSNIDLDTAGGTSAFKSGDITADSLKSGWTAGTLILSVQGSVKGAGVILGN